LRRLTDIPLFRRRLATKAIINPKEQLRDDERRRGTKSPRYPRDCIVHFYDEILEEAKRRYQVELVQKNWWGWLYRVKSGSSEFGMMKFGIGDSLAGLSLELLAASGVRNLIVIGAAGGIQQSCRIGDVILATRAIRGEGVSYHYQMPSKYSFPSPELNRRIEGVLKGMGVGYQMGTTWTTDAPFRETIPEIRRYQEEGVLCVEQEAAALFSIAKFRKVNVSSLLFVSDDVSGRKWNPQFNTAAYDKGRDVVLEAAARAFSIGRSARA
jgi:uridine phosphorylase